MWSIHPNQIQQILRAFAPTEQEIADASRILLAAQESAWGPIADEGLLHDRASYRYFWTILKRAQQTGRPIPPAAQHAFFRI
jgi:citrate lyase subunit beta/citryl-CoA lyase